MKFLKLLLLFASLAPAASFSLMLEQSTPKEVGHPIDIFSESSKPKPTIILLHGCNGVNAYGDPYRVAAKKYAEWGYNVAVLDSFSRRGYTNNCSASRIARVSPDARAQDVVKLIAYINKKSWHRGPIGVIGMDHGGTTVLRLAFKSSANAPVIGVALYPNCELAHLKVDTNKLTFPIQIHVGKNDDWARADLCKKYESSSAQVYFYESASHWFDVDMSPRNYLGHQLRFNLNASKLSSERIKEFLDKYVGTFELGSK